MDASQYKEYVLTLLALKYVSDKYAGKSNALVKIPENGSFDDIVKLQGSADIGERMNKVNSLEVCGIEVEVLRRDIKNMHLSVRPPDGVFRVSAPRRMDDDAIRIALVSRLDWIREKQRLFTRGERQPRREMVSGESYYFRGRRYRLEVVDRIGRPEVCVAAEWLRLGVRPGVDRDGRFAILNGWYRQHVKGEIPAFLEKWEPVMDVSVAE